MIYFYFCCFCSLQTSTSHDHSTSSSGKIQSCCISNSSVTSGNESGFSGQFHITLHHPFSNPRPTFRKKQKLKFCAARSLLLSGGLNNCYCKNGFKRERTTYPLSTHTQQKSWLRPHSLFNSKVVLVCSRIRLIAFRIFA